MTAKNCANGPKLVLKDLCEKSFVRNDRLPLAMITICSGANPAQVAQRWIVKDVQHLSSQSECALSKYPPLATDAHVKSCQLFNIQ